MRLGGDRPTAQPGAGGQPHLVVLDVITADVGDRGGLGAGDHPGRAVIAERIGEQRLDGVLRFGDELVVVIESKISGTARGCAPASSPPSTSAPHLRASEQS